MSLIYDIATHIAGAAVGFIVTPAALLTSAGGAHLVKRTLYRQAYAEKVSNIEWAIILLAAQAGSAATMYATSSSALTTGFKVAAVATTTLFTSAIATNAVLKNNFKNKSALSNDDQIQLFSISAGTSLVVAASSAVVLPSYISCLFGSASAIGINQFLS